MYLAASFHTPNMYLGWINLKGTIMFSSWKHTFNWVQFFSSFRNQKNKSSSRAFMSLVINIFQISVLILTR